ncbi:MAG TPA: site-specific integrase [Aliidongia sp.]|uniref:tyrosine-type recombinase/integrase n=1 Tax=Aliidongia sp. TaxID=1914230 RepID=UPI002DDCF29F|nr:site-specific integrase [Aliidongia sp.]HEV2677175.1 site-specific integrase [Aliidongia sp.]
MPKPIKRGPASYQIKVRRQLPDGSVTNINKTFDTYEEAQKAIDVAVGKVSGDEHVDKRIERGTSFNDLLERYRDNETAKRPDGHPKDNELSMIRKWQRVDWALWPLTSIESSMIAEWRDERVDEGQAPTTIGNPMNLLSKIFRVAKAEWGLKVENPVSGVARPEKPDPREVELRVREEEILLRECGKGPWQLLWCARIALLTGMRAGEIRRIQRKHIHLEESELGAYGYVHLPRTKNGTKRDVPLVRPEAGELFREIIESPDIPARADGFLFGDPTKLGSEGGYTATMLTAAFADAVTRAAKSDPGFKARHANPEAEKDFDPEDPTNLTYHDLRHVALTRLAPYHRDALDLAKTSGHKTIAMLSIYFNEGKGERAKRLRQAALDHDELMQLRAEKAARQVAEVAKLKGKPKPNLTLVT